jgi:nucleotide-binding universal stress UspA family protein
MNETIHHRSHHGDGLGDSTILIGRKGPTRREAFLFGSISSKMVHHAENGSVWEVE